MSKTEAASARGDDVRRSRLLDAAVETFVRFGFRKTSMEEVARAARISRQGLYLHYPTKEELFRAAVRHLLETGLALVSVRLRDESPVEDRLVDAFDTWVGRFVGMTGDNMADLFQATQQLVGAIITEHDEAFLAGVTKAMRSAGFAAAYKSVNLTARQLAETLYATARGLKYGCATRAEFRERMSIALKAMSLPLRQSADV